MNLRLAALLAILLTASTLSAEEATVHGLHYPDASLQVLIDIYSHLTRTKTIVDSGITGRATLVVQRDLSLSEAATLIEETLFTEGINIVQVSPDTVEFLNPSSLLHLAALPVATTPEELPHNERVLTYIIHPRGQTQTFRFFQVI